jgi:hypothetical protein
MPLLVGLLAIAGAYATYPYVTLCRLGLAIHHGDSATLASLVDWHAVREGIKEDICDSVIDTPAQTVSASGQLPAFGASFMRGVAGSKVDQAVTPEALATVAQRPQASESRGADVSLGWSFFDSLTQFSASITTPGAMEPIRLQLELRHGAWQVTRVWLPMDLLDGANSRT